MNQMIMQTAEHEECLYERVFHLNSTAANHYEKKILNSFHLQKNQNQFENKTMK
jgi:hypothetical protein